MKEEFIQRFLVLAGYHQAPTGPRGGIILPGEYHYCPLCGAGFSLTVNVAEGDTLRHGLCTMHVQHSGAAVVDALQGGMT